VAWLLALNGDLLGKWYALEAPCLVGRAALNHVIIDDPRVSRQHAKIAEEEGGYVVYDLNSANGTYVDEQPVKRRRLEYGQTVRFGPYAFSFKEARERAASGPAPTAFGRELEVRTLMGMQQPVKIVGSLDAVSSEDAGSATSLTVLEDAYHKLSTLYGFLRSIATSLDTDALVDRICVNLLETFSALTVEVFFLDEAGDSLRPVRSMVRGATPGLPRPLSPQLLEEVVRKGRAILSAAQRAPSDPAEEGTGHAMHAPMVNGNRVQGVLAVRGRDRENRYTQRDLDLLVGLSAVAALSMQNARMHTDLLRQQRLEQDLLLAQQIQKSFLPRQLPHAPRIELHAEYHPVFTVGGDFYDCFWLDERRIGVFIGDVAGKGVSAALLMARVSSDLRVAGLADGRPRQVLGRVNQAMLEREQPEVFVTGVFLTLDVESGKVILSNAGHCPPFVRRADGRVERIDGGHATAIGFFRDSYFAEADLQLGPGDALVLYTDGVIEAAGPGGEQFGGHRLAASLAHALPPASGVAEHVLADMSRHRDTVPQNDDVTMIVCAVRGTEGGAAALTGSRS
jgi:serine phosphatase RsbU (regulator of sigma subunit)